MSQKISLPLQPLESLSLEDENNWYRARNFIIRPLVLITTVNKEGTINASVKTNFMTASSMKNFAFYCSLEHHTYQNIMATKEFVINVPTENIISKVLKVAKITEKPSLSGVNEIEKVGLTPISSKKLRPPRVKECIAHYECLLDWHKENLIFGKVVAVSVDKSLMDGMDNRKFIVISQLETQTLS